MKREAHLLSLYTFQEVKQKEEKSCRENRGSRRSIRDDSISSLSTHSSISEFKFYFLFMEGKGRKHWLYYFSGLLLLSIYSRSSSHLWMEREWEEINVCFNNMLTENFASLSLYGNVEWVAKSWDENINITYSSLSFLFSSIYSHLLRPMKQRKA